ncbi:MAG: branched-chain amino acid transport system permease protein [Acidimicrobiaceae bacterium]
MNAVILSGFFVGLIYGLLGVGLVVVYRGSRVVNFAYGETGMVGAFVFADLRFGSESTAFARDHGLWVALPVGVVVAAALGALTERLVVRPLRTAPRIRPLVGTFAVGSLFFIFATRRWGLNARFTAPLVRGDGIKLVGLRVQPQQLLVLAVSAFALTGLWALYRFSAFGLRLRATALDPYAAGLVGVNVDQTSMVTWALAGALAGVSAILIAPLVAFNVGFMATLSIRGLAAAVVGGLTNVGGAFGAGILLGMMEAFIAFKSPISGITDVAIAGFILVLMLVRPSGLAPSAY